MTVYIDSGYRCHVDDDGTLTAVETSFFDGKCKAYIEGYLYIPEGVSVTLPDGKTYTGLMITPYMDHAILAAYQEQYEAMLPELQDMKEALNVLGVTADG